MNPSSNDVPRYRLPIIEEILDFSYDYISSFFSISLPQKLDDFMFSSEYEIMKKFCPKLLGPNLKEKEKIFNAKRLFFPIYWHLKNNHISIYKDDSNSKIYYCELKSEFQTKEQFKKEILQQEDCLGEKWVIPYFASNLNQIQDYL